MWKCFERDTMKVAPFEFAVRLFAAVLNTSSEAPLSLQDCSNSILCLLCSAVLNNNNVQIHDGLALRWHRLEFFPSLKLESSRVVLENVSRLSVSVLVSGTFGQTSVFSRL